MLKLEAGTAIRIANNENDTNPVIVSWNQFTYDNAEGIAVEEFQRIREELTTTGKSVVGGGASGEFHLSILETSREMMYVGLKFISKWVENCIIEITGIEGNDLRVKISRTDFESWWFETWNLEHCIPAFNRREYYPIPEHEEEYRKRRFSRE